MIPHHEEQHFQKQQISQKVQQPNIQLVGSQPNIQFANRQLQERKFLSRPADPQPILTAGQDQSRRSQLSMLGLQQHQQLSGAGSDMLRIHRNPNAFQGVKQEFVSLESPQQLSGAGSDRLRMQRNPNPFQGVKQEFVSLQSPQQAPQLSQLHQQQHFQKENDNRFPNLLPQNRMINQNTQLRQSERVLPEGSSALNDSTHANQYEWHDRVYQKFDTMRNMFLPQLDNTYRRVHQLCSQSQETAIKLEPVKSTIEKSSNLLKVERGMFRSLSKEKVCRIFQHLKLLQTIIARYRGSAAPQHRQQPHPPESQYHLPEPEQQMNMNVPRCESSSSPRIPAQHSMPSHVANTNYGNVGSVANPELKIGVRSMDRQTRHQVVLAQNPNQPNQQTLLDPQTQLMSAHKMMYDVNGSKSGQVARSSPRILQQQYSGCQVRKSAHLNANSPQTSLQSSSQLHLENLISPLPQAETALRNVASHPNVSSTSSSLSTSSLSLNSLKNASAISSPSAAGSANEGPAKDDQILSQTTNKDQSSSTSSLKILASSLMVDVTLPEEKQTGDSNESSLQRLLDAVKSISNEALCAAVQDIGSIMKTIDTIGGATVNCESRAFAYYPKNLLQGGDLNSPYEKESLRRIKRHFGVFSTPADVTTSDGLQGVSSETSYLESIAACRTKRAKFQLNTALLDEIEEINKRLIETALDLVSDSTENDSNAGFGEGTSIIRCSYSPVGLGRNIVRQSCSSGELPLFCAQLLVPADYPSSSPILLNDSFSSLSEAVEESDLSKKVNTRFSSSLRELPQPPSLKEMARKWDDCARSVLAEFAVSLGGGSFSTKHGKWESCV